MVDYSKWDRMSFSDSENEDDRVQPRVTRLEKPGPVHIGPDGSCAVGRADGASPRPRSRAAPPPATDNLPTVSGSLSGDVVDVSAHGPAQEPRSHGGQWRRQWTRNGGGHRCVVPATATQPATTLPVYWSQDRTHVTLRLGVPPAAFPARSLRVRVAGALPYADRCAAVGSGAAQGAAAAFGSVEISSLAQKGGERTVLLAGALPRPIHLNQDEDEIDFAIEDYPGEGEGAGEGTCTKCVTIEMPKAVPMAGLVLWWERPLLGYPAIDVAAIQERNPSKGKIGEGAGATRNVDEGKKAAFQKSWDDAHAMFRERVKTKTKQSIDIGDASSLA